MKGRIPDEVIDRVREHHDIVDVVSQSVQLKKSGRNYFGLCPFHSESTPSFSVSPDKQIYYCFGCGAGGNVFKFVMEMEQFTFVEAVHHLADQAGITVPRLDEGESDPEEKEKQRLREAMDLAARLFHHLLMNTDHGEEAREYLTRRGIQHSTMEEFQLGYAPDSYRFLLPFLKRRGFHEDELIKAGLVAQRDSSTGGRSSCFDRFRGRVMFPIHDSQGRVIAFGGRLLGDGRPKYLNSPETPLFHKGKFLFNLHRARKSIRKEAQSVLFEGYMDVIAAWQAGVKNGVATLGTSLTDSQARVIRRNAETVILCYDSDTPGQQAAERGMDVLRERECVVKVARMPHGMDPDDYIGEYGADAFTDEVLAQALPFTAFKLETIKKDHNLNDEDDRMQYLARAVELVARLPQAIERDHYLRRLSEEFDISLDALKQEQRKAASKKKRAPRGDKGQGKWNNGYHGGKHMVASHQRSKTPLEIAERRLLAILLQHPEYLDRAMGEIGVNFQTEAHEAIAAYLYSYHRSGFDGGLHAFIRLVDDDSLTSLIAELGMMDLPQVNLEEEVDGCIRRIRQLNREREVFAAKRELEKTKDPLEAARLAQESILRLYRNRNHD
ncbi:DNA primase [Desmospora profundinema]|uniref:DNA primase n=1 Tax=Desmospora profundinema TaxID=1571184 RepID=A0ABU1IJU3_9BACL|nr:DNA primase [Desmospora profundinema]MDR6225028.1 DNA primase [Desmospora profundinema]